MKKTMYTKEEQEEIYEEASKAVSEDTLNLPKLVNNPKKMKKVVKRILLNMTVIGLMEDREFNSIKLDLTSLPLSNYITNTEMEEIIEQGKYILK